MPGVSFVQQEWFLVGVHGLHSGHSDEIAIRDGGSLSPRGRQHLSAVVVGGVCKHVLESVCLGQQQPDFLIAPVDRRQVLQQHEEALQGKEGPSSLQSAVGGRRRPCCRAWNGALLPGHMNPRVQSSASYTSCSSGRLAQSRSSNSPESPTHNTASPKYDEQRMTTIKIAESKINTCS